MFALSVFSFFFIRGKPWFSHFNAHALLEKYSEEEINHFANFAFQNERLLKWQKNISVRIQGDDSIDTETIQFVKQCISKLDTILEEVHISFENKDNNVIVLFPDSLNSMSGYTFIKSSIFRIPYPSIEDGTIEIVVKNEKSEEINSTVYHEFTHLLGFNHNTNTIDYQSIFNPSQVTVIEVIHDEDLVVPTFQEYIGLDKAAIRIMYDADVAIDPGMTKKKFHRKIEEARRNMEK